MIKSPGLLPYILIAAMFTFYSCENNHPLPDQNQMVRLAKLVIDSTQLESYTAALKEEIEASVRLEPGVLTLYAVAEKDNPTHITILEIYGYCWANKNQVFHRPTSPYWKYTPIRTPTRHICKRRILSNTRPEQRKWSSLWN
jgi:4-carboxymuconolactone decarboxylase